MSSNLTPAVLSLLTSRHSEIRDGTAGSGVFSEPESARLTIVRNVSHGNVDLIDCNGTQAHGFYVQGVGHLVANNVVYDHTEGYGIQAYPDGAASIFAENTIVDNESGRQWARHRRLRALED